MAADSSNQVPLSDETASRPPGLNQFGFAQLCSLAGFASWLVLAIATTVSTVGGR